MKAQPADRIVKRISAREWLARYGALDLRKRHQQTAQPQMHAPADRIAVRA